MYAKHSGRLKKHDVLVDHAQPAQRWRIVDLWRDVYVLELLDRPWRRRMVYADELTDPARFQREGVGDQAPRIVAHE